MDLVEEVEPLFGSMANFDDVLERNIHRGTALVVRDGRAVAAGVLFSVRHDRAVIGWLAVRFARRREGLGRELLTETLQRLPQNLDVTLDAGADDYVTKPFSMDELLARLRAAVRRKASTTETPVVTTHFTIDLVAKTVVRSDGVHVRLTPTEWQLLEVLARTRGKLVTQRQLLQAVWGPRIRDRGELSSRLRGSVAAQARAGRDPAEIHHHRARHGVQVRRLTGSRVRRCALSYLPRRGESSKVRGTVILMDAG